MQKTIVWFRQDLRINDNPALYDAVHSGTIIPIYIQDTHTPSDLKPGSSSKVWLHHALASLNKSLSGKLQVFSGNPIDLLTGLIRKYNINQVNWNRCYDEYQINRDTQIKQKLQHLGIVVSSFNGSLLWEPWSILKKDGTPYKVYTPYYRKGCMKAVAPRQLIGTPSKINFIKVAEETHIDDLDLLPKIRWDINLTKLWSISEKGAIDALEVFINERIYFYKQGRDYPSSHLTSKLSPYLHFGQISPHAVWHRANSLDVEDNVDCFLSELGWREFSYYLLYYFPKLYKQNWQAKFDKFKWRKSKHDFDFWCSGQTGIPIIDAGMRELWQTGYMHNRVRMIVASFLTKNLRINWQLGAKWFFDTLFDADIASNSASWQWVAGSGADAQPYFRIFNPITQSEKFDSQGEYIKKYVPEIRSLPIKYLFAPWMAPESVLSQASIILGKDYPLPIISLQKSRQQALDAYKEIK